MDYRSCCASLLRVCVWQQSLVQLHRTDLPNASNPLPMASIFRPRQSINKDPIILFNIHLVASRCSQDGVHVLNANRHSVLVKNIFIAVKEILELAIERKNLEFR